MTRQYRILCALGLTTALLSVAIAERAIAGPYSIDILIQPYHPGLVDSWLNDINDQGLSTGYTIENSGAGPVRTAVTYRDGNTQTLSTRSSLDINNLGDVVGNDSNFQPHFVAADGPAVPIEVAGYGTFLFSQGCLNDSGNVLTQIFVNDPLDAPPNAFSGLAIWNQGGAAPLSALDPLYPYVYPPDPYNFDSGPSSSSYTSNVTNLNNANQFAAGIHGSDYDPMDPENFDDDVFNDYYTNAYIYDGQGGYSLLESPTLGEEIRPIDIDEAGTVLGSVGDQLALWGPDGALQSVLPDSGTALNVLGFNGYPSVQRNSLGQVVAVTLAGGVMFYNPVSNAWTDITPSISGLGTGTFSSIQGFNDLGQFVGLVRPPQGGGIFGYVVSPVPEPGSMTVAAGLLGSLACCRKRYRRGQ